MKVRTLTCSLMLLLLAATSQAQTNIPVIHERQGLPNVFAKLREHVPVNIVYFGGSITAGTGASKADETSYRGRVSKWFTQTFPESKVANIDAAIGGTGSDLGAFRTSRDVLAHNPDLVFVEYAVNDGGTPAEMIDRSMEGIVRQIRRANPKTDICFIYTFTVGWLDDFREGHLIRTAALDEAIAQHYGIPSVNVAIPAAKKLIDHQLTPEEFTKDGVHPTDAGHLIYADTLISYLESERARNAAPIVHAMPSPLRADNLEHAAMIGADEIKPLGKDWHVESKDPAGHFSKLLVSETPASEQEVHFSGPILAMFYVLGPDTGAFDYKIDSSEWKKMDPFDVFAKGYFRPHYRLLADGLSNTEHTVIFRIRADHNADSKGTFTRIGYLLENPVIQSANTAGRLSEESFGKTAQGVEVKQFTLRNRHGMVVKLMSYGATITEILTPDRHGNMTNVILGRATFEQYQHGFFSPASVIGRVANRIANAQFTLDGVEYKLPPNDGKNHLHGKFSRVVWDSKMLPPTDHSASVQFSYLSPDGEEGLPGNVTVTVTYTLTDDNDLRLDYTAVTDKPTPINLTNHGYFNLAGGGDVLGHELWIASEEYTETDAGQIPTGKYAPVKGTPLDFTRPTPIGAHIDQLRPRPNGYDHNYVLLNRKKTPVLSALVYEPVSGRQMEMFTTEPGVQLYTANQIKHAGLCMETQHYPDSVNHPEFPSTILRPGHTFTSTTVFKFSARQREN